LRLALFDLDHTLLDGDSDELWCSFLVRRGLLERASFEARNRQLQFRYRAGVVGVQEFCEFYLSTLAGRSPDEWQAEREAFVHREIAPRIAARARELVEQHRALGDELILTTATNRYITELTAAHLGIAHLIATEFELGIDGRFTGRTAGVPNMREGKVTRLRAWLAERGLADETLRRAVFYSDSANDLPLLHAVGSAVAVSPDAALREAALAAGWPILELHR
jgi:HAD superfamily hydrolase (TIGR01490 family)